jgi:hypothetical protein
VNTPAPRARLCAGLLSTRHARLVQKGPLLGSVGASQFVHSVADFEKDGVVKRHLFQTKKDVNVATPLRLDVLPDEHSDGCGVRWAEPLKVLHEQLVFALSHHGHAVAGLGAQAKGTGHVRGHSDTNARGGGARGGDARGGMLSQRTSESAI